VIMRLKSGALGSIVAAKAENLGGDK